MAKRLLLVLALVGLAVSASAQSLVLDPTRVPLYPANRVLTGDDGDVAILIGYPNAASTAITAATTVTVDANSINLAVNGAAASGILCPSGGTAGEIDITDSDCDTLGEVVDHINSSASGIKAVILDGVRSDYAYSSAAKLLARSATTLITADDSGVPLYYDTSALLQSSQALVPAEARKLSFYLNGSELNKYPFRGLQFFVDYVTSTSSTCTAAGIQAVYSVNSAYGDVTSETVVTQYQIAASGTSAVPSDFTTSPLVMPPGAKPVIRRSCGTGFVNAYLSGRAVAVQVR